MTHRVSASSTRRSRAADAPAPAGRHDSGHPERTFLTLSSQSASAGRQREDQCHWDRVFSDTFLLALDLPAPERHHDRFQQSPAG
jgi:hypothetical protein